MRSSSPVSEEGPAPKKVRTAPTNTSLLPPCKVCEEPAAGFHYGANTCEACKGFFRRSLLRKEAYRCLGSGNCNIRAGKRKICPKCRYIRCLSVGMSKEAIKTGRYTHAKRTQDILEYQRSKLKIVDNNISMKDDDSISLSATNSPELAEVSDSSQAAPHSLANSEISSQNSETFDSVFLLNRPFELSAPLSPLSVADNMLDNLGRIDEAVSPFSGSSSASVTAPRQFESRPVKTSSSLPASPQSSSQGSGDMLDDAECEKIVNHLLKSHEEIFDMQGDKLSPEELLEKQKVCYEACKLQTEVFGTMCLSEEEYQDVYQKTGLDIDNRQPFIDSVLTNIDKSVRRYIAFVKTIPGFKELTLKDQIKLIKNNRCEVRMMATSHCYNYEMKVMTIPSGRTECIHGLAKIGGVEHILHRFECAHAIQKLGLIKSEMVVLASLMIVTVGKEDVDEPEKVSNIQWKMAQCLRWLFRQNGRQVDQMFARTMSGLCRIRELAVEFYEWLKTQPFKQYTQLQDNALLMEWFSNS